MINTRTRDLKVQRGRTVHIRRERLNGNLTAIQTTLHRDIHVPTGHVTEMPDVLLINHVILAGHVMLTGHVVAIGHEKETDVVALCEILADAGVGALKK